MHVRIVGVGDRVEQDVGAAFAGVGERLADRRDVQMGGEVDVVVTGDRQLAGHVDRELACGVEHTHRLDVRAGHDRRRPVRHPQQLQCLGPGGRATVRRVTAEHAATDPCRTQRSPEAVLALRARDEPERVVAWLAQERDAPVTQRQHVVGRCSPAADVVDHHRRQRRVIRVERDGRERGLCEVVAVVVGERQRQHDEPSQVRVLGQRVEPLAGPDRRVHVHDHDVEPVRLQAPHQRLHPLVGGRLVEERDEHTDVLVGARADRQPAGLAVLQLADRELHPVARAAS